MVEVVVSFVDIGEIVDHYCLNLFFFHKNLNYDQIFQSLFVYLEVYHYVADNSCVIQNTSVGH